MRFLHHLYARKSLSVEPSGFTELVSETSSSQVKKQVQRPICRGLYKAL